MSDFIVQIMQQCSSGSNNNIRGYQQTGLNTEHPTCTCRGYYYYGYCKHIRQAQDEKCQYHEQIHGEPEIYRICPFCGKRTEYVKVGV